MKSEKIDELAKALIKFQSQISVVEKNTQGYGYKYADLAQIVNSINKPLKESGLAYTQLLTNGVEFVTVTTMLLHESGQYIESILSAKIDIPKTKSGTDSMTSIQAEGSIITYLRRYSLASILGIVTDEDIDGANPKASEKKTETKITISQPKNSNLTENDSDRLKDIQKMILEMVGKDSQAYKEYVLGLTTFVNKEGKTIKGIETLGGIKSSTQCKMLFDKVSQTYKEFQQGIKKLDETINQSNEVEFSL